MSIPRNLSSPVFVVWQQYGDGACSLAAGLGEDLAVRMEMTHEGGIFEGLKEEGEVTVFVPWYRVMLALTPWKFDSVA
jgi:hypothetical protein